jgi:hypothetical protein
MSAGATDNSASRHRESGRRHLRGKAKRTGKLAAQIAKGLSAPTTAGGADVPKLVAKVLPALASLRRSVLDEDQPEAKVVAGGISDLSRAFEGLAKADRAATPEAALKQLAEGHRALESAETAARKAGDAWPL